MKNRNIKIILFIVIFCVVLLFSCCCFSSCFVSFLTLNLESTNNELKNTEASKIENNIYSEKSIEETTENEQELLSEKEIEEKKPMFPEQKPVKLPNTKEEYENVCEELYYLDVFGGTEDMTGKYVKLDLFLAEERHFTEENKLDSQYGQLYRQYSLRDNLHFACVLHEGTDSYVGESIYLWYSNNYDLKAEDYELGDKIIVYGKVAYWSSSEYYGNKMAVIPKFIDKKY